MSSCLLDRLPVECLYMIFEYFWAQEIFHSFLNVTQYINQVLNNYNNYLLNFKSIRKQDFDLLCRSIKPCQIISLTLSDNQDTVGQSQLFLSFFSINQLIHLHALTLINIDRNSISTFSDIHKLPCLVSIEIDSNSQISINLIASQLKRFIVNSCSYDYSNHGMLIPSIQLPRLRYLSLERCSFSRLYSILRLASNLISLHVSIIYWSSTEMNHLINNDQEPPFKLFYFYMTMNVRNSIQQFLLRMPSLRHIELIITRNGHHSLCDGYQWEIFIRNQLTMLTKFDFYFQLAWYQTHDWVNDAVILAPFLTSFWIGQERQWFVVFDRQLRSLFTVPRFAPTICSHLSQPILPHATTLPREQHGIFYDHITELIIDNSKTSTYRYKNIQKLSLSTPNFDHQQLDLSKVGMLTVKIGEWTLEMLIELIHQWMPMLSHLIISWPFYRKISHPTRIMSLVNIRTLNISQYSRFSDDEILSWTQIFPCVQRLIIYVNTRRRMAILIDQFEHLSSGSFFINNSQIGTVEKLREPQVTREWFIKNTRRLSINNNFTCRIDYQYRSWVHLWIGDRENRSKMKRNNWLGRCFPRCLSDTTAE